MLFDFQPPIVKNGETMSEKQMRDYLYKLVDKLTLVLNNIDDENMRSGKTIDMTSVNNSIASLRGRVTAAEAEIDALQLLATETQLSSTISATETAATEYALTFNNTYSAIPVVSSLVYNSSPTRYFGLVSLILTGYNTDANGNYTGANFKICNNHTAALNVRVRSTIIGLKKE